MKYFVQSLTFVGDYQEVSKEDYVDTERLNGFYNTLGKPEEPATSCFTGMYHRGYVELDSLMDFSVPRDSVRIGYAMQDGSAGETIEVLVDEDE